MGPRLLHDVQMSSRRGVTLDDDWAWSLACSFWVLVVLDWLMSASLGRPCAIQEEEYVGSFQIVLSSESYDFKNPELAFKQPTGKPSPLSYFVCFIELTQVVAGALRTIYSINKSKLFLSFVGPHWEQQIVAVLDSALNEWINTLPNHLKWNTTSQNLREFVWFLQSASSTATNTFKPSSFIVPVPCDFAPTQLDHACIA
ncbi:hypothetical protein V8E53_009814 [Lactarius tabidus]